MEGSPGRKEFLLRLSHDLFDEAKSYADKENVSITRYINRAIETYVKATDEVDEEDRVTSSQADTRWWV